MLKINWCSTSLNLSVRQDVPLSCLYYLQTQVVNPIPRTRWQKRLICSFNRERSWIAYKVAREKKRLQSEYETKSLCKIQRSWFSSVCYFARIVHWIGSGDNSKRLLRKWVLVIFILILQLNTNSDKSSDDVSARHLTFHIMSAKLTTWLIQRLNKQNSSKPRHWKNLSLSGVCICISSIHQTSSKSNSETIQIVILESLLSNINLTGARKTFQLL